MVLSLVTAPTTDPLDLETVKKQCRMEGLGDEDAFFTSQLIPAVRDHAELATGRALLTQTWDLKLDAFPLEGWIEIPKPPLISVTSVTYVDTGGVTQTFASSNYLVDAPVGPRCRRGRVALASGQAWPTTQSRVNAVTVRFVAGYGASRTALPPLLVAALLMDVATRFEHREGFVLDRGINGMQVPGRAEQVYRSFRSYQTQTL